MAANKRTREVVAAELATVKSNHDAMANDVARAERLAKMKAQAKAAQEKAEAAKKAYYAHYNSLKLATGLFVRRQPLELDAGNTAETYDPSPAAVAFCEEFFGWKWNAQDSIDRSSGAQQAPFRAMLEAVAAAELAKDARLAQLRAEKETTYQTSIRCNNDVGQEETNLNRLDYSILNLTRELNEIGRAAEAAAARKAAADPQSLLAAKEFEQKRAAVREKVRTYLPSAAAYYHRTPDLTPALAEFAVQLKKAVDTKWLDEPATKKNEGEG